MMGSRSAALAVCAAWLSVAVPAVASADELVAGWEGGDSRGYVFASPTMSFAAKDAYSWVLRGTLSYLYYDVTETAGTTHVRSPGEAVAFGLRYSAPNITATIAPGYEIRQTRRHPASGGEENDNESGVVVQGDVFYQATPLVNVSGIVSYSGANDYVWARAGIKRQVTNLGAGNAATMHVGMEVTGQGNRDGHTAQFGGLFEFVYPAFHASLQLRAGYSRLRNPDGSHESMPYFGVGFYRSL